MTPQTQPSPRAPEETDNERDCRLIITRSLSQRTSSKSPWYRGIGVRNAESATAGLMNSHGVVPRDILRGLDLPPNITWARLAVFLRGSLPAGSEAR